MSEKNMKYPKVSVIIPCFHTEKFIDRCLESLSAQTYRELEIICVNDCSGVSMEKKLAAWRDKDARIKIVNNEKNLGLFHTRIEGAKVATGDYIAFIDSDDYVERDFYRSLVFNAIENKSDVTFANICCVFKDGLFTYEAFNKEQMLPNGTEENFFDHFAASTGRYYRWHVIWDKLISKKLWDDLMPKFTSVKERFMMCEDVVYSTLLLSKAKNISFVDDVFYFYDCSNPNASTNPEKVKETKVKNTINDITTAFRYTQQLLDELKVNYNADNFRVWRNTYICDWLNIAKKAFPKRVSDIEELVASTVDDYEEVDLEVYLSFGRHAVLYNPRNEEIVDEIVKHDVVSFDIFDTLVLRPFYSPADLFEILNDVYIKVSPNFGIFKFSDMRKDAEHRCRQVLTGEKKEDVTLDEIYDMIHERYGIDKKTLKKMQKAETEAEIKYCYTRLYGKKMYDLSLYLGKHVCITSDMYLPSEVIEAILKNNGFDKHEYMYVSCVEGVTKWTGGLFRLLSEKYSGKKICHIDDRKDVCKKAKQLGITGIHVPRTLDVYEERFGDIPADFCDFNHDNEVFLKTTGVRTSVAMVANKLFDNPFLPYDIFSVFNNTPFMVGYYALGMHLLSLCNWLIDEARKDDLDSLSFLARDGYLPYKAMEILSKDASLKTDTEMKYIYTSRAATMPIIANDSPDFYAVTTYVYWGDTTPRSLIKQLHYVLKPIELDDEAFEKEFSFKPNDKFTSYDDCLAFLDQLKTKYFDQKRYDDYYDLCEKYYNEQLTGKAGVFDIGYSGKPEQIFAKLVKKPVYTYFVHVNSSQAFDCNHFGGNILKTFFDYKPTITGMIRELLFSSTSASCVGYKKDGKKVVPVYAEKEYADGYSADVLNAIQSAALQFVQDYVDMFEGTISSFDYNRYYMSVPLEYYYQYSRDVDRVMFSNLKFDHAADAVLNLLDFWKFLEDTYNGEFNNGTSSHFDPKEVHPLPRSRAKRIAYYMLFDRSFLRKKLGSKINDMSESPSSIRRFSYCILKDKKRLMRGMVGKVKRK